VVRVGWCGEMEGALLGLAVPLPGCSSPAVPVLS